MTLPATAGAPVASHVHARFVPIHPSPTDTASGFHRPPIPLEARKPKLLDHVRHVLRVRHYSYRTEKTYVYWIKRFIFFHGKRHPREMGKVEVEQFLTSLAVDRHVSAATQNQALHALLFCTVTCWRKSWGGSTTSSAKRPQRLPRYSQTGSESTPRCTRWSPLADRQSPVRGRPAVGRRAATPRERY